MTRRLPVRALDPGAVADGEYVLTVVGGVVTGLQVEAGGGGSIDLDDLADVDLTGVADGDVLTFDSGSSEWVPEAPAGGGGGTTELLACVRYNPAVSVLTTLTTTDADLDATNLTATITVPASGAILVEWTSLVVVTAPTSTGSTAVIGTFRSGGATVTGTRARLYLHGAFSTAQTSQLRLTHRAKITGLTPGASYTVRPGAYVVLGTGGSPAGRIGYGDDSGGSIFGPFVFNVWSA